ncbi:DUF1997 domain-containing protein [Leptolyngbya sp. FACHB-671]|uniref:DUF1997 domain-containing protein n=1 Tax=unclassified Leptolyngbya TaxID=2650499 RepID=UPI001684C52A|nr:MULTISPECIES: DUF1997 domain-containing protein [unclassified Leptolyngbya]MBD1997612.1 DUF1997 domain-containing protein [Leptolyngbya sp. FACHB-541]MBD2069491.1 DUF1997 domain-containing protein [Leptolyngbya sp. FACHB-671]
MQANSADHQPIENSNPILSVTSGLVDGNVPTMEESAYLAEPTCFHGYYKGCMDMYADAETVAKYLDAHHGWFRRCAHPMKAEPLGENGYTLIIGRFGSFGYEVEPKVGLDLLPQDQGVYRIKTISIPGYEAPGYDVDFQAALELVEANAEVDASTKLTQVVWELNLEVYVQFPRFIHALPKSLVQSTGDRLLNQVVRQVSRCLTHKVQEDFHASVNAPLVKKSRKKYPWSRNQNPSTHD